MAVSTSMMSSAGRLNQVVTPGTAPGAACHSAVGLDINANHLKGATSGWVTGITRPVHMGRYAMERIRRVDEPTTLVLREEITRVPKRADLFTRALAGDLGDKAKTERTRFAVKHPLALAMTPLIRALVPMQGTREPLQPTGVGGDLSDSKRNADAIKAL
eukprot:gene31717-35807_t